MFQNQESYQNRVGKWMIECFGPEITRQLVERSHRFLEEALELSQSMGCTKEEAIQLVEYTFSRDKGDTNQEVGGVMVTLAALCFAASVDMEACAENELQRVWEKIEEKRNKHASKPANSPLPQPWDAKRLDEAIKNNIDLFSPEHSGTLEKWKGRVDEDPVEMKAHNTAPAMFQVKRDRE